MSADLEFYLKLAGAVLTFLLGIWIGLGAPGIRHRVQPRAWDARDRLRATWLNRIFSGEAPRRFDAGRLIVPKEKGEGKGPGGGEGGPKERPVVRLRRD
jgi:hypothetical protein